MSAPSTIGAADASDAVMHVTVVSASGLKNKRFEMISFREHNSDTFLCAFIFLHLSSSNLSLFSTSYSSFFLSFIPKIPFTPAD
jgi:hypothetical protein